MEIIEYLRKERRIATNGELLMDREIYTKIVDSIYSSALDPKNWQVTIELLQKALNSQGAGFFVETKNNQLISTNMVGLDPHHLEMYSQYYANKNPWFTVPDLMKPGFVATDHSLEVLFNDRQAFAKTEYCQDWALKQEFRHLMGGKLIDILGNNINFSFMRSERDGYYTETEINFYKSICPHLIKAIEINARLDTASMQWHMSENAIENLSIGIIALSHTSKITFMNLSAKNMLGIKNGLLIQQGHLTSNHPDSATTLSNAIERCKATNVVSNISIQRDSLEPLSLSILPSSEDAGFLGISRNYILVFIVDPENQSFNDGEFIRQRWKLAPLEVEYSLLLLKGFSINEIASIMDLTKNTSRWYSKQIMKKLDVSSQNELIIKLMKGMLKVTA